MLLKIAEKIIRENASWTKEKETRVKLVCEQALRLGKK